MSENAVRSAWSGQTGYEWWSSSYWLSTPLQLTAARRTKFNTLFAANPSVHYRIAFSDWYAWGVVVDGQTCSPTGIGLYLELTQSELQFFERDTYVAPASFLDLRQFHDSLLYKSPNPRTAARLPDHGAVAFNKTQCLNSLVRIINGCDGNDPDRNPLDFKFGGTYVRGGGYYTYQVNPRHDRTLVTAPTGDCHGDYKFLWDAYTLGGAA
ncbi:hypothetical protein SEUCBS140593_006010 [Sporothrix eucalyptigena]|uniref:Uncharacterized protein n=1 Tax=Sporothrix eucalyptigena TaxID=1812306 RepID=A0ABP0C1Q4_9PEZI